MLYVKAFVNGAYHRATYSIITQRKRRRVFVQLKKEHQA